MEQDLNVIQNFNVLPKKSLELLGQRLGLKQNGAELLFCARHYKSRGTGDISIGTLRFIDALACPALLSSEKIAIGDLLTDHAYLADTFADAVSKLKALGKHPDKPFTLRDIADLSARYSAAVNTKDITEPIGFGGTVAQYASDGMRADLPISCTYGRFDVLKPLPILLRTQADYADALVLLCPAPDAQDDAFDSAVTALLCGEHGGKIHCICDVSHQSPAHAVLHVGSGAVLDLAALPEQLQNPLALTECRTGLLLSLAQDALPALAKAAGDLGLCPYRLGVVDHAGYLIIRCGKDTLLSLDVSYLKSICFIRSYTLRLDVQSKAAAPCALTLHAPEDACDETDEQNGAVLRTLPPLRTRNASFTPDTSFHAALLCALQAYCTATATGSDPRRIWLDAQLWQRAERISQSAAASLCGLLGLYRFSMELGVPVHADAQINSDKTGTLLLASAPADMIIPAQLQGHGNIYLLAPQVDQDGLPVWSEMRALLSYVRRAMLDGKIKSARVLCNTTPADELTRATGKGCQIILNPYGMQVLDTPCIIAFMLETDSELEGELIAVSAPTKAAQSIAISDNNS